MYILTNINKYSRKGYLLSGDNRSFELLYPEDDSQEGAKSNLAQRSAREEISISASLDSNEDVVDAFRKICQYFDSKKELFNFSDFDVGSSKTTKPKTRKTTKTETPETETESASEETDSDSTPSESETT